MSFPVVPRKNVTWELRDPQFLPFPHEDLLKNVLFEQFNAHVQGGGRGNEGDGVWRRWVCKY